MTKYFGLYCPQCNAWLKDSNNKFIYYPAAEMINAMLAESDPLNKGLRESHSWQAQEFGKEQPLNPDELPEGTTLCPSIAWRLRQIAYREGFDLRHQERTF